MVDAVAGLTDGHRDKATGPSRSKPPNIFTLMALIGALGYAVVLVEDSDRPYPYSAQTLATPV
jgi:hypothetical protein